MLCTFFHTCETGVLWLIPDMNSIQEAFFEFLMIRRAFARSRLKAAKLVSVGYLLKIRSARFRILIAFAHSSVHHGTGSWRSLPEVRGTLSFAASMIVEVSLSTFCVASRVSSFLKLKFSLKVGQSALWISHLPGDKNSWFKYLSFDMKMRKWKNLVD